MRKSKRYTAVHAVISRKDELIPLWDNRVSYGVDSDGNESYYLDESCRPARVIDCVFDVKEKILLPGIYLDFYPKHDNESSFKKGDSVYYEANHYRKLKEGTIVDIVYEDFELEIVKGERMDGWWKEAFKDINIEPETIYAIRKWKSYYILDNGQKIDWEHKLYQKDIN